MKKTIILFILALTLAGTLGAAEKRLFTPYAISKRVINIGSKPALTLVKDGKVCFEVVRPANPVAGRAARELVARLSEITGKKISAVKKASGKVPAFYLGVCPESKAAGINPEKLDRDGFYIKTVGNKIFITGVDSNSPRMKQWATLFGVYDFLERFAGVRYYFPGKIGTIVPEKKNWSIPEIDIAERPDTQFRWIWTSPSNRGGGDVVYAYPGMKENNPDIWRNSSLNSVRSCHGLNDLELAKRFRKSNPEFFAMTADGRRRDGTDNTMSYHKHGHLCYSSEGLLEEVYKDAVAALTGKPASSRGISRWSPRWNTFHVNPAPNDGMLWCLCPRCKKITSRQDRSNHIWKFFTGIAKKLKENNIPGMVIVNSYGAFSAMPTIDIPDNVSLGVAVSGPWSMNNPRKRANDAARIKAWHKRLNNKVSTWTYPTKAVAAVPYVPNFTPRAISAFYKSQRNHIYGGFVESGTDFWLFGFLNHYICGKVMWDFDVDTEKIIDEHCRLMYGAGAPYMAKLYLEIENLWMNKILKETVQTSWGENWLLPTRRDVWTKIYSPAKVAELTSLFDKAEKAAAKDKKSLERLRFMRQYFWGPVLKGAATFAKENASRSAWTLIAADAGKITVDGKLNETAWKKAVPINLVGSKWKKVEVQTTVKVLQDKDYFYFGFEAEEPLTDKISALLTRGKDSAEIWRDSGVEIFLSAESGSNFIYQFMINAAGATCDLRNETVGVDVNFNSGFTAKVSTVPGKKYFVEVRIPRKSMPELAGRKNLMANFTRSRTLKNTKVGTAFYVWYPKDRNIAENCGILVLDPASLPENLIKSPDFEKKVHAKRHIGPGDWSAGKVINRDTEVFLTRGASLRLEAKGNNALQTLPVVPGRKYRFSFYVKTENASPGLRGIIRFGGAPAQAVYVLGTYKDYIRGTNNWHRVDKVFTAPKVFGKQHKPRVNLFVSDKEKGKVWIDHVELIEEK